MKKRYMVGLFFIFVIILVCIVLILWNRHIGEQNKIFPDSQIKVESEDRINQLVLGSREQHSDLYDKRYTTNLSEQDEDTKYASKTSQTGYYLKEDNGYVCIYYAWDYRLFYQSDIRVADLPEKLQEEIKAGKYMEKEIDVYHFLESYSS